MKSFGHQKRARGVGTEAELELGVDANPDEAVDFEPPVRDWIECLARRLARELIKESERTGA